MFFFPGTIQVPPASLQNWPQADSPFSPIQVELLSSWGMRRPLISWACRVYVKLPNEPARLHLSESATVILVSRLAGGQDWVANWCHRKIVNTTANVCCSWHWMLHEHLTVKAICFESSLKISRWRIRLQIIFCQSRMRRDIIVWRIETVNRLFLMHLLH